MSVNTPHTYACHLCPHTAVCKAALTIHLAIHLPVDQRPYQCPTCGRKFANKYNLRNHERTHDTRRIKKFKCEHCDLRSDRQQDLARHTIVMHNSSGLDAQIARDLSKSIPWRPPIALPQTCPPLSHSTNEDIQSSGGVMKPP
jgi:DNA-directed RNA polymerase subunit RPC12/RpoP